MCGPADRDQLDRRAVLRVDTTATAALTGGDVDGAFVAAYDGYRMTAEALLARQALRATGGDGSHMAAAGSPSPPLDDHGYRPG